MRLFLLSTSALAALAIALPAAAQPAPAARPDQDNGQVAEIIVTAQKREESVQKVPIAVSVVGSQQLDRQQVSALTDLSRSVPSLEFGAPAAAPAGGGILRGIGTNFAFSGTAEAAVGIVVDGVPQGNVNTSNIFDVNRVEVLKGPQGMLFGQSTSAGVINMTTNAPDPTRFSARLHGEVSPQNFLGSNYGRYVYRGILNLPVSATSALRVSAHSDLNKDVQHNNFTRSGDRSEDLGFRARYLWNATPDVTVNLIADYDNRRLTNGDFITYAVVPPQSYVANLLAACGITPTLDNKTSCASAPQFSFSKNYGVSGQVDWSIAGGHTITYIGSFRGTTQHTANDVDTFSTLAMGGVAAEPVQLGGPNKDIASLVTQELRIASPTSTQVEYTLGLFYSNFVDNSHATGTTRITTPFFSVASPADSQRHTQDRSEAVFGQATYHATDVLRFIAGGRYSHVFVDGPTRFNIVSNPSYNLTLYPKAPYTYTGSTTVDNFSWRVGTQYDFAAHTMGYFTVTRGFKGPQIDTTDNTRAPVSVLPELPLDFELGLKTSAFDGRLAIDANLFYDKVKDFQATNCRVTGSGLTAVNVCAETNLDKVVTKGIEIDAFGRPFRNFTINAGLTYDDVKYPANFIASDGTSLGGYQLSYAPKFKANISGEYTQDLSNAFEGFVSVAGTYKSEDRLYTSADPKVVYPAHWIVDGRIGARSADGRYELALFVKNAFDKREAGTLYPSVLAASLDQNFGFPGSPYFVPGHASAPSYMTYITPLSLRVVGVSFDAKF